MSSLNMKPFILGIGMIDRLKMFFHFIELLHLFRIISRIKKFLTWFPLTYLGSVWPNFYGLSIVLAKCCFRLFYSICRREPAYGSTRSLSSRTSSSNLTSFSCTQQLAFVLLEYSHLHCHSSHSFLKLCIFPPQKHDLALFGLHDLLG